MWAAGGSDGTMTFASHAELVENEMRNYGQLEADLLDDARYPMAFYYDSGYPLDTKLAMLTPLGLRKDIAVILGTQDASAPMNSPSAESSIAITLKNAARLYPESTIHGTPVCRALIVGHAGELIGSKYKGPNGQKHLPLTVEFAAKAAAYMGAGTGIWNAAAAFDMPPNNQIQKFKNLNVVFKNANVRQQDWRNGLIWAQSYDMRSIFWPGLQTVYDDDTSVLNSFFNMAIAVDLEKVAQRAYRDLTGISGKLTQAQFIQRSNQLILDRTEGRYDGRVTIRPDTYFTAADEQRGYSWRTDIHMYGENMRTVGTYTVVAHRSSDLELAS
ncbi:tail sheath [Xanthomonas phage RTH11]|nr:tail sheath [Xanthomonas phage RTH11]